MQVEIHHAGKLIGCSHLDAADPPMGVATGFFEPTTDYDPKIHAGEIDGVHQSSVYNLTLVVNSLMHGKIECHSVFIQDYSESLDERHVSILAIPYPDYETYFGDYPAYKAYWNQS
tara:strand:- start:531 stop:878 length:348 start_codon:yes stop_codon:yes gene_type:complete